MICRFCGLKIDSATKCPHCSHDAPVTLSYKSYSNNTIVDKLCSVLQTRPQKDEDTVASSVPVILDAEAALQQLNCDSSNPVETNHESNPVDNVDETSKECASELDNTHDDKRLSANQVAVEPIESENLNDESIALPEHQSTPDNSGSQLSDDNSDKNSSADVLPIRIKKALKSHFRFALIGTAIIALAIGFMLGYVAGKAQDREPVHNNPEETSKTTVVSSTEEIFSTTTTDQINVTSTDILTTYTRRKDDDVTTISDTATTINTDLVREGVLREKESEEIQ